MKLALTYDIPRINAAFAASGESFSSISNATGIAVSTVSRLLQTGQGYSRNLLAVAKALKLSASDIVLLGTATQPSIPPPMPFMSAGAQTKMGGKRAKQLSRSVDDILFKSKQKADATAKPKTTKARKTASIHKTTKAPKTSTKTKAKAKGRRAAKAGGAIDRLAKDFKFRERAKTGGAASNRRKAKKR